MNTKLEQRANIKFCLANKLSVEQTYQMLKQKNPTDCYTKRNVYNWYKKFKNQIKINLKIKKYKKMLYCIDNAFLKVKVYSRIFFCKSVMSAVRHSVDSISLPLDPH